MQYIAGTREFHIDEPTVVSIGKFDGLHRGHRKLLREMLHWKEMGYKVAIFTFSTPPGALVARTMATMIMTNEERVTLLQEAGVDYLVEYPFDEKVSRMDPEQFVAEVLTGRMNAEVIVTGPDCRFGYRAAGDRRLLEQLAPKYGYRFFVVDKERDGDRIISSTYIREVLAEGNIKKANELLGYCYFVSGRVVHGNSIGHSRLYPTANLLPPKEKHLPKFGVYVSRVTAAGRIFAGLTNVGRKPTIEGDNPAGVETYLYDFAGNLYGMQIKVELLDFVRPEKQFDSIEDLKRQLDHDVAVCKERYLALAAGSPEMIGRGKL